MIGKMHSSKLYQVTKPGNATVYEYCMNVASY